MLFESNKKTKQSESVTVVGVTPCLQRTLVLPKLEIGEVNRTGEIFESASGKGTNVFHVLQQLGCPAHLITTFGGSNGAKFLSYLEKSFNSEISKVNVPFETRICQTLIDTSSGQVTELVEESKKLDQRVIEEIEASLRLRFHEKSSLVLSGSPPPGSSEDIYSRWIQSCQDSGGYAFVDCQKQFLKSAIQSGAFLVKANQTEWEMTLGKGFSSISDCVSTLKKTIEKGVSVSMMTLGERGMICCCKNIAWLVQHPSLSVVNPIGSGDATMAGLVFGILTGESIEETLKLGAASGMANTQTKVSGVIQKATLEKYLSLIDVRKLS